MFFTSLMLGGLKLIWKVCAYNIFEYLNLVDWNVNFLYANSNYIEPRANITGIAWGSIGLSVVIIQFCITDSMPLKRKFPGHKRHLLHFSLEVDSLLDWGFNCEQSTNLDVLYTTIWSAILIPSILFMSKLLIRISIMVSNCVIIKKVYLWVSSLLEV